MGTIRKRSRFCDGSHPVCIASDSGLRECMCWCAECAALRATGLVGGKS